MQDQAEGILPNRPIVTMKAAERHAGLPAPKQASCVCVLMDRDPGPARQSEWTLP
jgi:hypothetical protein